MYKCENCNSRFEEPEIFEDGDCGYECGICPECESDDIVEFTSRCEKCLEYIEEKLLIEDYCQPCIEEMKKELMEALKSNRLRTTSVIEFWETMEGWDI